MSISRTTQRSLDRGVARTLTGGSGGLEPYVQHLRTFNGVDQRQVARNALAWPTEYRSRSQIFSMWFRPDSTTPAATTRVFHAGNGGNNDSGAYIELDSSGTITVSSVYNTLNGGDFAVLDFLTLSFDNADLFAAGIPVISPFFVNNIVVSSALSDEATDTGILQVAVNGVFYDEATYAPDGSLYEAVFNNNGGGVPIDSMAMGSTSRSGATRYWDGTIGDLYFDYDTVGNFVDLKNTQANIDAFYGGGSASPGDPGEDGSTYLGKQPAFFYGGRLTTDDAGLLINRGHLGSAVDMV